MLKQQEEKEARVRGDMSFKVMLKILNQQDKFYSYFITTER
jgi:hypothetical protein